MKKGITLIKASIWINANCIGIIKYSVKEITVIKIDSDSFLKDNLPLTSN